MTEEEDMLMSTKRGIARVRWWTMALTVAALLAGSTPPVQAGRDRGVNQPGAAGNRGGADPGINQPGAAGNVGAAAAVGGSARQTRAAGDPGFNQPGAAGNGAGAPGNRPGDPGVNQPGAAGNRR